MFFWSDPNKKVLKKIEPLVGRINKLEGELAGLSDFELQNKSNELKEQVQGGGSLDDALPKAFALCREGARRTLGQRHFDVQLIGGIVLHQGQIAEMKTGEGKTLTATLAVYLNALSGGGVHIVTVNDYLARRDTVWMGQIYHFLGLTTGCLNHEASYIYDATFALKQEENQSSEPQVQSSNEMQNLNENKNKFDKIRDTLGSFKVVHEFLRPCSRKEAYAADITYGTNNEFGFDYLRDNMAGSPADQGQRGFVFAIVDEVDSILIDEARTPLIISAPAEESAELYSRFARLIKTLKENEDYNLDLKMRAAALTDRGIEKIERALNIQNIYAEGGVKFVHHLEQALRAETLFWRDKDYVVREGEVIIIDEFTGRLMPGRRYSEGLHQAIEAKEGVKVQRENQTLASVTFQNFFRMYKKLAGMTGTAATEAEEFSKIYNLEVVSIPTNRPMIRADYPDRIYKNRPGKLRAAVLEIKELHARGQPVLVGTISVQQNEELSDLLRHAGIPHNILNAKNHEREAEIIAQAGGRGAVTVATNMAGRGVDIILGGAPYNEAAADEVRALGGLAVLGTERHEARRIDNQLRGRSGRQGDSGFSRFYISLEDDLMKIFAAERIKFIMERLGVPEDMPIENKMVSRAIESAQRRVEGYNFDIRKHLLEYDDVLNRHRATIYLRRQKILEGENLKDEILKMIEEEIEQMIIFHTSELDIKKWDIKEICQVAQTIFPVAPSLSEDLQRMIGGESAKFNVIGLRSQIIELILKLMREEYDKMEERLTEKLQNLPAQLFKKGGGGGLMREIEKGLLLRAIDTLWVEHLDQIDYLRTGIGLRGYAGRDPLVEYKKEAYRLWNELLAAINKQVVYSIFKIELAQRLAPSLSEREGMKFFAPGGGSDLSPSSHAQKKVGRNDPCPCGSGKKYKRCHGA